jgi:integrase
MATIYPRKGCWYLNWSEAGKQRRKSLGAITAHQAETLRIGKELELRTGKRQFVASALFDDHLDEYLRWHRSEYPDSHFRVQQIADQHLGLFRGKAVSQITAKDIDDWKVARLASTVWRRQGNKVRVQKPIARSTVAKELRTVHAIFQKAVRWKHIEENPAEYTEKTKSTSDKPPHFFTRPQLVLLYRCAHGLAYRLIANAGLRRSEALKLRWETVDMWRRHIDIHSEPGARTKSGKWRRVPMSDGALEALRELEKLTGGSGYVLPRITAPSLSRACIRDARRLKLPGSIHSLRHAYGAHMVMAGVSIRKLKDLMGHANIQTTMIYAQIAEDHQHDQARSVTL